MKIFSLIYFLFFFLFTGCSRKEEVAAEKMHSAVLQNHSLTVKELLLEGVNVNVKRGEIGDTPIILAVKKKHLSTIKILLDYRANLELKNNLGLTPLMIAIKNKDDRLVEVLLIKKSNPNALNNEGEGALHLATKTGQLKNIIKLISYGGNVLIKNKKGRDPLDIAKDNLYDSIIEVLKKEKMKAIKKAEIAAKKDSVIAHIKTLHAEIKKLDLLDTSSKQKVDNWVKEDYLTPMSYTEIVKLKLKMNDFLLDTLKKQQHGESDISYYKRLKERKKILDTSDDKAYSLETLVNINKKIKQTGKYKGITDGIKNKLAKSMKIQKKIIMESSATTYEINNSADLILYFQNLHYFEGGKSDLNEKMKKILKAVFPLFVAAISEHNAYDLRHFLEVEVLASAARDEDLSYQRGRKIFALIFKDHTFNFKHKFYLLPRIKVTSLKSQKKAIILRFTFVINPSMLDEGFNRLPASIYRGL